MNEKLNLYIKNESYESMIYILNIIKLLDKFILSNIFQEEKESKIYEII
jgi:hypothetical protein